MRLCTITTLTALVALVATAGAGQESKKRKSNFPEEILHARYVCVIPDPSSGIPLDGPDDNRVAQRDVEAALRKWGRFNLTSEPLNADLVIVVRKFSKTVRPALGGGAPNDRPVVVGPGDINVGVRMGTPPPTSTSDSRNGQGPAPRTEISSPEDVFTVYRSGPGVQLPLDSAPLWRYISSVALKHPSVPAVEKFRKAIEEAEKLKP